MLAKRAARQWFVQLAWPFSVLHKHNLKRLAATGRGGRTNYPTFVLTQTHTNPQAEPRRLFEMLPLFETPRS